MLNLKFKSEITILIKFKVSKILKVPLGENTVHQTIVPQTQLN